MNIIKKLDDHRVIPTETCGDFVVTLTANELCAIKAGTHHKVSAASNVNRICVITVPKWDEEDEHLSEIL